MGSTAADVIPSAVLRAEDEDRREAFDELVADLRLIADVAG